MKKIYFLFFIYSVSINSQTLNFGEHIENKKITNNIELAAIFNSKEKFDISFSHKDISYSLKSYVPFWGKTLSNICWVGFFS